MGIKQQVLVFNYFSVIRTVALDLMQANTDSGIQDLSPL